MLINEVYKSGGDYLKADDLQGKPRVLTISLAEAREFEQEGQKKMKIVLSFRGTERQLVLNVTNATMIAETYGNETNAWKGQQIELRPERVQFAGRMVDAIRVYPPAVQTTTGQAFQQPATPPPAAAPAAATLDDDLPF